MIVEVKKIAYVSVVYSQTSTSGWLFRNEPVSPSSVLQYIGHVLTT